ncbi:hypothetical protein [Streptomyces aidingensis]|uniref:Uncharacterized protein n=1 Tax=Streptomyces aidingensis TaxID=910347 RepID=A0A1I1N5X9_9ACTN|nr:hypothetical protein [Streptomyces aidingensis]SFC89150.1 hypothetical protein SAMN05421773_10777 [Streptomyces aidingensis]
MTAGLERPRRYPPSFNVKQKVRTMLGFQMGVLGEEFAVLPDNTYDEALVTHLVIPPPENVPSYAREQWYRWGRVWLTLGAAQGDALVRVMLFNGVTGRWRADDWEAPDQGRTRHMLEEGTQLIVLGRKQRRRGETSPRNPVGWLIEAESRPVRPPAPGPRGSSSAPAEL